MINYYSAVLSNSYLNKTCTSTFNIHVKLCDVNFVISHVPLVI